MPALRILSVVGLASLCIVPAALAQYTAGTVRFTNSGPYSQAELELASGVRAGTPVTGASLGAAAQRLSDTALFEDVGATFTGPAKAVVVTFTLKPFDPASLVRPSFGNLVWLSAAEREAALHAALPLYHGTLPLDEKTEAVADAALTAAVTAKGALRMTVTHLLAEPAPGRPYRAFDFSAGPEPIVVDSITLSGVPAVFSAQIAKVQAGLKGSLYNEGLVGETTSAQVLAPLLDVGYLDARLDGLTRSPVPLPAETGVRMEAVIVAGEPYRVASIDFAGTPVASQASFREALALHPGDPASRSMLDKSLAPIRLAYQKQGYLDAVVDAVPAVDKAQHTVAYNVFVTPGEVYRLRNVQTVGLGPVAQSEFNRGWLLKTGDVYNADYATHFLVNNTALQQLQNYGAIFKAKADPETHLVDLVITFKAGPGAK